MRKLKKTKILIATYIILIITELFLCVPYHKIQLFKSKQNVPHIEIIGSGYTTMYDITNDDARILSGSTGTGKIVNTSQIFMNIAITTFLAITIYFLLRQRKPEQTVVKNAVNTDELIARATKEKDMQLQQALRDVQIFKAQNMSMSHTINEFSRKYAEVLNEQIKQMPVLDINGLAFADDETIAQAQIDYAKKMAEYVKKERMIYKNE